MIGMKKITAFVCAILLITAFAFAQAYAESSPGTKVQDGAGIFSASEANELDSKLQAISSKYDCDAVVITISSMDDYESYQYYNDFYEEYGYSKNTVMLLLGRDDGYCLMITFGKLDFYISESRIDEITVKLKDDIVGGAYYQCALDYIENVEKYFGEHAEAASNVNRVVDNADLITVAQESTLRERLNEISARQQCDVVIVTVNDIEYRSPMQFADDYYDYNGYADDGLVLLISMAEHDWWISTKGYGITAFTDAGIEYIGEEIVPYLSDGYYGAFTRFADLCDEFITKAKTDEPYDIGNLPKGPLNVIAYLFAVVVGLIVAGIGTGVMKSKLKSVRQQLSATQYVRQNSMVVTSANELFLYANVSRTARETSSSGGGGGSSTHHSSSGSSHGGGGGKF